jgi:hypothetical protein
MTKHISPADLSFPSKHVKLEDTLDRLEKSYDRQQDQYTKSGLSQQSLLYLKLIIRSPCLSSDQKLLPLLKMLEEVCRQFLLNDLELTMWSIILEFTVWKDASRPLQMLLLYSAFAAKTYLNLDEDLNSIKAYLAVKYPGFFAGFDRWFTSVREKTIISPRVFNKYFSDFALSAHISPATHVEDLVDYNYYVDELLQIAPPAGAGEKSPQLDFSQEPDEPKLPELMNLNSILDVTDPTMMGFPELPGFSSVFSLEGFVADVEGTEIGVESPFKPLAEELC